MTISVEENENENAQAAASTLSLDEVLEDTFSERPADIEALNMVVSGMTAETAIAGDGDFLTPSESPSPSTGKRGRGRPRKNPEPQFSGERPEINGRPRKERPAASQAPHIEDKAKSGIEPAAQVGVMMVQASGMMLGGEEAAMRENEILLAKQGFVGYFEAKGVENVPAWIILAGGLCPYYLRVLTQTPARSTVPSIFRKCWFGVKEFWRKKRESRINSRDNGQRENHNSNAASN